MIKVNGVRIACRGGNWGMDDSRKRVSRERLEPYFKLHHDANLNIIRNWVGQSTEETFYQLADECTEQRTSVMDDTTGMAKQYLADSQPRLRYPGLLLWGEEGVRTRARAT